MATRIKSKTLSAVPQSKDDCAGSIRTIGDVQREFERERAEMNDAIAATAAKHQPALAAMTERLDRLQAGVQAWCEANRAELCGVGDKLGKTANLVTGDVSWRQRPPSIRISNADAVTETLLRMGLGRFVRVKNECNKEAMLQEPEALRGIAGITIVSGVEDFIVTPFEATAEAA